MTTHAPPEWLVGHVDGTLPEADDAAVLAHLRACADCARRVHELRAFDGFVQAAVPADVGTDAAMFAVAERLLANRTLALPARRRAWVGPLLLAAMILLVATLYAVRPAADAVRIERALPASTQRAGEVEHFHLELGAAAPRTFALLAAQADGSASVLFPSRNRLLGTLGTPQPLPAGSARVPADDLYDWEFDPAAPPRALWLLPCAQVPGVEALDALQRALAGADAVPAAVAAQYPGASRLPFPGR